MLDLQDYQQKASEAVMAFWENREKARQKQIQSGKFDQGERAGVTGGKNMDGFIAPIIDIVKANGLEHAQIHQQRAALTLPGYFWATSGQRNSGISLSSIRINSSQPLN